MWQYVDNHFRQFLDELELREDERADAERKAERIARSLYAFYYPGKEFDQRCYEIVGSYGKGTAARPRTDIDMIFILPWTEWSRIDAITWNKQSYLLQEVKRILIKTSPTTDVRGDGPVVIAPFTTYKVEVVPCWRMDDGRLLNAHTKEGGHWVFANPAAELRYLNVIDTASGGMARDLIKMLKAWKEECNVEMRSVCLEIAAVVFVDQWEHKGKGIHYYDFMIRDFFQFLLRYVNGLARPAGLDDWIPLGDYWESKAQSAYTRACKACGSEHADDSISAMLDWQKVFGFQFKLHISAPILAGLKF